MRGRRSGYVSLLAMAFSLGLAILGTMLAASLSEYVRSAALQERRTRADMRLESAVATVLAHVVAGSPGPGEIDGVEVLLADPMTKLDPAMDPAAEISDALLVAGIDAAQDADLRNLDGLLAASTELGISARDEDCLRRILTFGRAPADRAPAGSAFVAAAGAQVDIRASFADGSRDEVLWVRARFSGDERGWLRHDHRRLSARTKCAERAKRGGAAADLRPAAS